MSEKLKKLVENRDAILLAEIGALIHDLGKLHKKFVEQHAKEFSGDRYYKHENVIKDDSNASRIELKQSAEKVKNLLRLKIKVFETPIIELIELIEKHHSKDDRAVVQFVQAADQFDSEEDRAGAIDKQSINTTFKSTAFGYEEEIDLDILEDERIKVYEKLAKFFGVRDISKKIEERENLYDSIKKSFSNSLGMTARGANDVILWDHSYMTATIMKVLRAYNILDSNFVVKSKQDIMDKRPFMIFAVGWDFFGFIGQSHKIPDVIGRIKIINEIKKEIKSIVEEKYALGNSIYDDDFGIYFLIPSALDEDDLKEVKENVFNTFNSKTNGILLPVFHLEKPKLDDKFRIGKLLIEAMRKVKEKTDSHQIELITTPAWVEDWTNTKNVERSRDKLVCSVCGKGFYYKGDDEKICKTCEGIRSKGRVKEIPQTVFVDEIAWNPDEKQYENVCLLIAKFDLDEWLNGRFVQSLFIRVPDIEKIQWLKNFYNSKLCKEEKDGSLVLDESLIKELLSLGALDGYLKSYLESKSEKAKDNAIKQIEERLQIYDSLDNFSKELLSNIKIKDNLEKAKKLIEENNISELQKVFSELNSQKVIDYLKSEIRNFEECILSQDNKDNKKHEQQIIKNKNLKEILHELFQKPPSPSRLMRVWHNTTSFFSTVSKKIEEKAPNVVVCNIKIKIMDKKLVEGLAYTVKIPKLGISGEVVCEENCEMPGYLRVVTPHLSEFLIINESKAIGTEIEIYHPERKNLVAIATIDGIIPVKSYKAYRTISISPTLFMAMVPASKSWEIVKMIKDEYMMYFGKVFGKLPLHIGLIYFKRKMPIFVALDSAMRFVNEFESLKSEDELYVAESPRTEDSYMVLELNPVKDWQSFKYKFRIPFKLGNGNPDYYHPYLMVKSSSEDTIEIKCDESPIIQKHILKIKEEDIIKINKYYLDFEFLDSNIRRFDIGKRRKHWLFTNSTNRPKPYLLWDIDNFERLRELIIDKLKLTTTQIMNLYEMLIAKIEEWDLKDTDKLRKDREFKVLVENSIKSVPLRLDIVEDGESGNGRISKKDYEFLKESILNGMFFDFVDLWHTILKEEFGERGEEK